jgi:ketol-acid reductoisomerase
MSNSAASNREPRFVHEVDADPGALKGRCIAVVGYGNLGRSVALNLRDSGMSPIVVGEVPGAGWDQAAADGFTVLATPAATARAQVVFVLVPDDRVGPIFDAEIAPHVQPQSALVFASGYPLAFGLAKPAGDIDVLLIAPRMLGANIRRLYIEGQGVLSYVCAEQDVSGRAWPILLALARAIGALQRGALVLSAAQEAQLDLFVEQTVGPDLGAAIMTAFHIGCEQGLPPEALVLELYMSGEMSRTIQAFAEVGFLEQVHLHGFAACFGGLIRTLAQDREALAQRYRAVLEEIKNGLFAQYVQEEVAAGHPSLQAMRDIISGADPITQAEQRVRANLWPGA